MSKQAAVPKENVGMIYVICFVILFVVSAAVIWLANSLFPQSVVLGTMSIPPIWAIVLSAGVIALIDTFALPLVTQWEMQRDKLATPIEMSMIFLGVNFAVVWLITRVAEIFGLGVSSWLVVFALAFVLDAAQGISMMWLESVKKKS